jgi:hypothetical protein
MSTGDASLAHMEVTASASIDGFPVAVYPSGDESGGMVSDSWMRLSPVQNPPSAMAVVELRPI